MSRIQFRLSTAFLAMTWLAIACVLWPASAWLHEIIPGVSPTAAGIAYGLTLLIVTLAFFGQRGLAALLKIRDMDL